MLAIEQLVKRACDNGAGLYIGFLERTHQTFFLALQHRRGKRGLLQHARKHVHCLIKLGAARQRAHAQPRTVAIKTPCHRHADFGGAARDFFFVHAFGAQPHDAIGHARHTLARSGVVRVTRGKVD